MIATLILSLGAGFVAIGTIGVLRFKDVYSRLQASGVSDNAGLGLVLIGLIVYGGWNRHDLVLLLMFALLMITNPIVTHSIARSAFVRRHRGGGEAL